MDLPDSVYEKGADSLPFWVRGEGGRFANAEEARDIARAVIDAVKEDIAGLGRNQVADNLKAMFGDPANMPENNTGLGNQPLHKRLPK